MSIGGLPNTKPRFRIAATAKHRNRPRSKSVVRGASSAGSMMEMMIMACCANLMAEISGLKAHSTLAPAKARYANRQMTCGGNFSRE